MEPLILPTLELLKELAREQAAERERDRVTIGFLYDIPPVQLSDEQIRKYNQELMRQYAALIPALRPPISILYIK